MRKITTLFILLITSWGFSQAQITLPYAQNLEGEGTGSTGCGAAQVFTVIEWTNETGDDADWVIDINGTGSSSTGPTANGGADHNPGISGGKYLYIEASGCVSDTANLVSDEIYTDGTEPNIFFEFWYHQYGAQINMNILQVRQIVGGNPGVWTAVDTLFTPPPGIDQWQQGLYDLSAFVGDTFQIRFRGVTGTSFGSDNALDDFQLYSLYQDDAGIVSIDAPTSPVVPGPNNVDVTIQNFGVNTLTSANIAWTLNGAAQTPFAWTGSLTLNQSQSGVSIGSANISTPLFKICAWTEMPNMQMDSCNANDTTCITGCSAPLRGIYTLGGPGADFDNFTDLGIVLSACGIDSHTIVNVNPGVYAERLILDHVPGTGINATLTIDGGPGAAATISNATGATIYLDGTDYTTIQRMTIEAMGLADSYGVQLRDTAEFNTVDSCRIMMNSTASNMVDVIGVSASATETSSFTEGQNALWTTVSNCYIRGGEKGIHFEGQNANRTVGNRFMDNTIEDVEDYGFYMDDQDSMLIHGNVITGLRGGAADGIYCFDIQMFEISENQAYDVPDWGLYVADGNFSLDGTPTSRGLIVNNMISSITDFGAYFDDFENTDIYHNTFGNTSTFAGGLRINDFTGLDIRNNIFFADVDFAFESDDPIDTTANTINYNDYYSNGANVADIGVTLFATLAAWQTAAPGLNANSVDGDPVFIGGISDMHVLSPSVNDVGDNSVGILVDFEGDVRPAGPAVDLGADEFTPINNDAFAVQIISPEGGCGDSNSVVTVVIRNLGILDITNLPITVNYAGAATGTLNFTYTDTLSFNEYDTVNVGIMNTYLGGTYNFSGFVTLTGDQDVTNDSFPPYSVTFIPFAPQGINGVGCGVDSAYVYGASYPGAAYWWFATPTDTVPLANADSFMVPSITAQNTYYLQYASNSDSLETTLVGGNGCGGGNMFDVTATSTVNINGLTVNTSAGANTTFQLTIHWIPNGTYVGNETNGGAWPSSVGPFTVTSAGGGNPTYVDMQGASITIPAGATYAMFVEFPANYTNGSFTYTNADISIQTGVGLCGSFSGINNPRSFNGRLIYGSTACSNIRVPVSAVTSPGVSVNLGADTTVCGTAYTLDAGTNATNYDWSTTATTQTISATSSGTYSVVVSDTFGCEATDDINLTLNTPPSVALGPDILLCDGVSTTLDAANPGSAYMWSTSATSQTITVSTAGSIDVVVTDTNGCVGMDTIVVTTGATPAASFASVPGGQGLTYAFTDQSTGTPTTWSWNFGDGNTDNTQNPTHTYANGGNYTVTLTVTNDCGSNVFTQSLTVVSVEQALAGGVVSLYPNPNNGSFNLEFRGLLADDVELRIMDVKGQVVMETSIEEQGSFVKAIDMTNFAKGMYLLQITAQGEQIMQRFVVE